MLVGFFLTWVLWRWVIPSAACRLFTMEVEQPVRLKGEWQGEVVVIPEERLVMAPQEGKITILVQNGQWVAPGSILAEITLSTGETEVVYSPSGGIALLETRGEPRRQTVRDGEVVLPGKAFVRIVRPNSLYLGLELEPLSLRKAALERSAKVQVREIASGGASANRPWYPAEVMAEGNGGPRLRLTEFPWAWLQRETLSVTVRMEGPRGIRVPAAAIVKRGGRDGVFVVGRGSYEFRPVVVLDKAGGDAVVEGLNVGEKIVTRPGLLMAGEFSKRNGH